MPDLPIRKQIRLNQYDYSQNGAYFITMCVDNHHEILWKDITSKTPDRTSVGDGALDIPRCTTNPSHNIIIKEEWIMNLEEKQVSSKRIYEGSVIKVRVDDVVLPDGNNAKREIVEHGGAVCVLPLADDNQVYMVKQFRYAFSEVMLEVPAGKLDSPSEIYEEAALRELKEETGLTAKKLIYLGDFRPSVAIFTEVIHMYLAIGLEKGETHFDDDEFLENFTYSLDELVDMVMKGEITDGKTIACVLKTKRLQETGAII